MDFRDLESLQFGIYSSDEIIKNSVCEVNSVKLTGPNSVYDERMGIIDSGRACPTCGMNESKCIGHFGHIPLNIDVFHPLFHKFIMLILKCVCYKCSRVLLSREQLNLSNLLRYHKQARFNKIVEKMDKIDYCTYCETLQPKYVFCTKDKHFYMIFKMEGETIRMQMHENEIRKIFEGMIAEDVTLLGFDVKNFHPKNLILRVLPVIPPIARPFVLADNMTCDDDLTIQYQEIVKANHYLGDPNTTESRRAKFTHSLKFRIKSLFDNSGDRQKVSNGRPMKGLKKRLTGKEGIIRNNLMGKRVDKSARTVIGPDPTLAVDEIAVPREIANILCVPVHVNETNRQHLQDVIARGEANFILRDESSMRINLRYATMKRGTRLQYGDVVVGKTTRVIQKENDAMSFREGERVYRNGEPVTDLVESKKKPFELRIGDVVERRLRDGDVLLLNRQPTLHRGSMMAQKVVIREGKTIRLNLAITKSFNADFDGDEMNLHCPASPETEAELRFLSGVSENIISSQSSKANIVIVQDALLGAYLMTHRKNGGSIPREVFFRMVAVLKDITMDDIEERRARYRALHGGSGYNGKVLFSLLLPDDFFLTDENKTDPEDPILVVEAGLIVRGMISKSNLTSGARSIITLLYHEYGDARCIRFINEVQFLCNKFLEWHGFSIGIGDCLVNKTDEIQETISRSFVRARSIMEHTLDPSLREAYVLYALSGARDTGMLIAKNALPEDNGFLLSVNSGSKGDFFNLAQIMGVLGQQNLNGERIRPLLTNYTRTLPHYPIERSQYTEDMEFESAGFIRSSFIHGLNPREYFFHAMTGREGITDTAMKTATSGYIQRRMVKIAEDVQVRYDGTVRNSSGAIIQMAYGENYLDPKHTVFCGGKPFPLDVSRLFRRVNHNHLVQKKNQA
jgi:DNA-directed RNA polymerase beta' subunit